MSESLIAALERITALRKAGAISDAEFVALKSEVLAAADRTAAGPFPFLSTEWFEAANTAIAEYERVQRRARWPILLDVTVSDKLESGEPFTFHIDTTAGGLRFRRGHNSSAPVGMVTDLAMARVYVIDRDEHLLNQAFMEGRIKMYGDPDAFAGDPYPPDPAWLKAAEALLRLTK